MGKYHERKEANRSNNKLVFSQKSLDDWKRNELARMRESIKDEVEKAVSEQYALMLKKVEEEKESIKQDAMSDAVVLLIGIPVRILKEEYGWGTKKRLPEFADLLCKYYNEVGDESFSINDYRRLLWEDIGIGFDEFSDGETDEEYSARYEKKLYGQD